MNWPYISERLLNFGHVHLLACGGPETKRRFGLDGGGYRGVLDL